jgi:hydrogenase maturation protease
MNEAKPLVIGLGNPILGDDSVGWRVAQELEAEWKTAGGDPPADVLYLSAGGLSLMEQMLSYERVLLLDAIVTGEQPIGTVISKPFEKLPNHATRHSTSTHDTSLYTALETGRNMDFAVPETVWVVAIEIEPELEFSEALSPAVLAAVPEATEKARQQLDVFCKAPA